MSSGFHRVHLRHGDGDHITVYVPLTAEGRLDPSGHVPWLLKALWGGSDYLGELQLGVEGLNRIVWDCDDDDSLTDFGTVAVVKGALVTVHWGDANSVAYQFMVRDVARV